jgi:hypothetical protein
VFDAVERVDEPADFGAVAALLLAEHGKPRLALEHERTALSLATSAAVTQSPADFSQPWVAEVGARSRRRRGGTIGGGEERVEIEIRRLRRRPAQGFRLRPPGAA